MLTFKINGIDHEYDNERLMFSEAMEIQRATGMSAVEYESGLGKGDTLSYGLMFWLSEVRALAAAQGCPIRDAVKQLPWDQYDVNLHEAVATVKNASKPDPTQPPAQPQEPAAPAEPQALPQGWEEPAADLAVSADPVPAVPSAGLPESTSPDTSEPPSPAVEQTPPTESAAPISESSLSSSESAPGSGTS